MFNKNKLKSIKMFLSFSSNNISWSDSNAIIRQIINILSVNIKSSVVPSAIDSLDINFVWIRSVLKEYLSIIEATDAVSHKRTEFYK